VVLEDSMIIDDSQEEPPLVANETTSQKIKRVPAAYRGYDSSSNGSSTTRNRRQNTAEGMRITIEDEGNMIPQRTWLSRIPKNPNMDNGGYTLDSIGGEGSYVYIIDTGFDENHIVSNLRSVGCSLFFNRLIGILRAERRNPRRGW
jgi:hypothetical protein